ncbi:MAG: diguanylate cyclase [Oleispira antarctica]|nr:diguanylate cyclase [Oleispira antarctica]MBQ0793790.1 diguanylate cyclase [Oleispira antarctica]
MDISKSEKLKQHFSTRVTHQARHLLDLWRCLHDDQWQHERILDLLQANEKLLRFAQRFDSPKYIQIATQFQRTLAGIENNNHPSSEQLKTLNDLMLQLSQGVLRRNDQGNQAEKMIVVKKPIYMALNDSDNAIQLAQQMEYFGLRAELFSNQDDLNHAIGKRHPLAIIIDIDFQEIDNGLTIIAQHQGVKEAGSMKTAVNPMIPVLFYSSHCMTLKQKLQCLRLGGISSFESLAPQAIITQLESLVNLVPEQPFRILIVDDSKSQALFAEKALNAAGMITEKVTDPMEVWNVLESFQPEMILMDMYMPGCNGVELAKVIRQDKHYINIPIIYLSGEEDKERQLAAMAEGGEDFLTKPVDPRHLLSTIRTRGARARELSQLIARDSLTGLYNHTHILKALDEQLKVAQRNNTSLCFVMVDIDHFKQVNDNHGHPIGDDVIKNLALFLSQRLRKTDFIGRYGGEEFAIVLPNVSLEDAESIMNEIRNNFSHLLHGGLAAISSTFSCGIALHRGQSSNELIELADQAMYLAKRDGRNCVKVCPAKD